MTLKRFLILASLMCLCFIGKGDSLSSHKKELETLKEKQWIKSADSLVSVLLQKAKDTKDYSLYVYCLIQKTELMRDAENPLSEAYGFLREEKKGAGSPFSEILSSFLSKIYAEQFSRTSHFSEDPSLSGDIDPKLLETWGSDDLLSEMSKNIFSSVAFKNAKQREILKSIPLKNLEEIFSEEVQKEWKKKIEYLSLFDFLADQAVNTMKTCLQVSRKPSLSDQIIDLYDFRIQEQENKGLQASICLQKTLFLYENKNKDFLFAKSLEQLYEKYKEYPQAADILFESALYYHELSALYFFADSNTNRYRYANLEALSFTDTILKNYPSTQGAENAEKLAASILHPYFRIHLPSTTIPSKSILASLVYKNTSQIHLRIYPLNEKELQDYRESFYDNFYEDFIKYNQQKASLSKVYNLELPLDHLEHRTEIALPALPKGTFLLQISDSSNFSPENCRYSIVTCSHLSYVLYSQNYSSLLGFTADRTSGKAMEGVKIDILRSEYDYTLRKNKHSLISSTVSDKNGFFRLDNTNNGNQTFSLRLSKGDDVFWEHGKQQFLISQDQGFQNKKKAEYRIHWFSDRSVYKPGQTIYIKGVMTVAKDDSSRILPNTENIVFVFGPNQKRLGIFNVITDDMGSFDLSYTIPKVGMAGIYRFQSNHNSLSLQVENYTRPSFEIILPENTKMQALNDTIRLEGLALAYAGSPLKYASVEYTLSRREDFPFRRNKGFFAHKEVLRGGCLSTNEEGKFVIDYVASAPENYNKEAKFIFCLEIKVTDLHGETQIAYSELPLSEKSFFIKENLPENIVLGTKNNQIQDFNVSIENIKGSAVAGKIHLAIFRISPAKNSRTEMGERIFPDPDIYSLSYKDFVKLFPNEPYYHAADKSRQEASDKKLCLQKDLEVSEQGYSSNIFDFFAWENGVYEIVYSIEEKNGKKTEHKKRIKVIDPQNKKAAFMEDFWISSLPGKGNHALFIIGSALKGVKVYGSYLENGEAKTLYIPISKEQKLIEIPLTSPCEDFSFWFVYNNRFVLKTVRKQASSDPKKSPEISIKPREKLQNTGYFSLKPKDFSTWEVKIKNIGQEKAAVLVAAYDEAIDITAPVLPWRFEIPLSIQKKDLYFISSGVLDVQSSSFLRNDYVPTHFFRVTESLSPSLDWNPFAYPVFYTTRMASGTGKISTKENMGTELAVANVLDQTKEGDLSTMDEALYLNQHELRDNFKETAFFYPNLRTDTNGALSFSFHAPDALSRWRLRCFAYTNDLRSAYAETKFITHQNLMLFPKIPTFLREGDSLVLACKTIGNDQGKIRLQMNNGKWSFDQTLSFQTESSQYSLSKWGILIPKREGVNLYYTLSARAEKDSDALKAHIPLISVQTPQIQSQNFFFTKEGLNHFRFSNLPKASKSLEAVSLTLEFTQNPLWYVIKALPLTLSKEHRTAHQVFSAWFIYHIGAYVVSNYPELEETVRFWTEMQTKALESPLHKNEDLILGQVEYSPWAEDAVAQREQLQQLHSALDKNLLLYKIEESELALKNYEKADGGYSWTHQGEASVFVTQKILSGKAQLVGIGLLSAYKFAMEEKKHLHYLGENIRRMYENAKIKDPKNKENHLNSTVIEYLYMFAAANFKQSPNKRTLKVPSQDQEAFDFFLQQALKFGSKRNSKERSCLALVFMACAHEKEAKNLMESLKQTALIHHEQGMYWAENAAGGVVYELDAIMCIMQAFDWVLADESSLELLGQRLISLKRTQDWGSTVATAEAVFSILRHTYKKEENSFSIKANRKLSTAYKKRLEVSIGNTFLMSDSISADEMEKGSGYFKKTWFGNDIPKDFENIQINIVSKDSSQRSITYGGIFYQYRETARNIPKTGSGFSISRSYFLVSEDGSMHKIEPENTAIRPGSTLYVQLDISADRSMDYVHLETSRPAGLDWMSTFSGNKYSGGLSYYMQTEEESIHYYFNHISKGHYKIAYKLKADQAGSYSDGRVIIECMYEPVFRAQCGGERFKIIE